MESVPFLQIISLFNCLSSSFLLTFSFFSNCDLCHKTKMDVRHNCCCLSFFMYHIAQASSFYSTSFQQLTLISSLLFALFSKLQRFRANRSNNLFLRIQTFIITFEISTPSFCMMLHLAVTEEYIMFSCEGFRG